jgi:hypothetical protein
MRKLSVTFTLLSLAGAALAGCSKDDAGTPVEQIPRQAAPPAAPVAAPRPAEKPAAGAASAGSEEAPPSTVKVLVTNDEDSGERPVTVHLEAQVTEGSGTAPYTFLWDFGDGSPFATTAAVTHVYSVPGSFRASVVVTDAKGDTDQDYADVDVERPDKEAPRVAPMTREQAVEIFKKNAKAGPPKGENQP